MKEEWPVLVEAARQGDNEACAALYNATVGQMMGLARSMVKNDEDALDLLQESYLYAFRSLGQLERPEYFGTWLYRIVINRCKNFLTRSKPRLFESSLTGGEGEEWEQEDEDIVFRPDESLDYSETKRLIREIVDGLPEDQRACILLYYFQEKKIAEIARDLEVSENTVKSRLSYGKKKIRQGVQALEKQGAKLYAVPVFPFIKWMLAGSAEELAQKKSAVLFSRVLAAAANRAAAGAAGSSAAGSAALAAEAGAAAAVRGGAFTSLGAKVTAGALAALLTVGGGLAIAHMNHRESEPSAPAEEIISEPVRPPALESIPGEPLSSSEAEEPPKAPSEPEEPEESLPEPGQPTEEEPAQGNAEEELSPEGVIRLINSARKTNGLEELGMNGDLMEIAQYQATADADEAGAPIQSVTRQLESYGIGYAEKKTMGYANYQTAEDLLRVLELTGDFVADAADFDQIGVGCCWRGGNRQLHWYILAIRSE